MEESDTHEIAKKRLATLSGRPAPRKTEPVAQKKAPPQVIPKGYAVIKKIRHWSTDDYTRVVIETDRDVKYSSRMLRPDPELNTPPRLYVDLEKTVLDHSISVEPITKGLLEKISFASNRPGVSRIVLYIKDLEGHKVFPLKKSKTEPVFPARDGYKGERSKTGQDIREGRPLHTTSRDPRFDPRFPKER